MPAYTCVHVCIIRVCAVCYASGIELSVGFNSVHCLPRRISFRRYGRPVVAATYRSVVSALLCDSRTAAVIVADFEKLRARRVHKAHSRGRGRASRPARMNFAVHMKKKRNSIEIARARARVHAITPPSALFSDAANVNRPRESDSRSIIARQCRDIGKIELGRGIRGRDRAGSILQSSPR